MEKSGNSRTGVNYSATVEGRRVTDDYAALRGRLLIEEIRGLPGFSDRLAEAARTLNILTGNYEEVSRVAATYRR